MVVIASCYGMGRPGIEYRWGQDFVHLSRTAFKPTPFPTKWAKLPRRGVNHSPAPSSDVKERVELSLYSPLCLRGRLWGEVYFFVLRLYNYSGIIIIIIIIIIM